MRTRHITLIASILGLSWLGMQVVHEMGHVLVAWASGETVSRVILHPLAISRTDVSQDKHPLLVIWGGPLLGSGLPLIALGLVKLSHASWSFLIRFFAGFCLIANGAYLGVGSFSGVGDAGDLLRHGAPEWALIASGLAAVSLGLWLWNGLGPFFGLGKAKGRVSQGATVGSVTALVMVVLIEWLLDRRE